jgi:hypothetical protein
MIIGFSTQIMPEMAARFSFCWTAQQSKSDKCGVLQKAQYVKTRGLQRLVTGCLSR